MIEIRAELKQWGNSYGIRIPKSVAEKAGLKKGDVVSVPLKKETFAISDFFGICKGAESFERERGLLDRF
jgi:antitoxin component of MazEF toxin-antitoxin module